MPSHDILSYDILLSWYFYAQIIKSTLAFWWAFAPFPAPASFALDDDDKLHLLDTRHSCDSADDLNYICVLQSYVHIFQNEK